MTVIQGQRKYMLWRARCSGCRLVAVQGGGLPLWRTSSAAAWPGETCGVARRLAVGKAGSGVNAASQQRNGRRWRLLEMLQPSNGRHDVLLAICSNTAFISRFIDLI